MSRGTSHARRTNALVTTACAALLACKPSEPPAPATLWVKDDMASLPFVQASRTFSLNGGGTAVINANCEYREDADASKAGFWMRLVFNLKNASEGELAIDSVKAHYESGGNGSHASFETVRLTGEAGTMPLVANSTSQLVYSTNQTSALTPDASDPTKVELPQKVTIPLSDGRAPVIEITATDKGFQDMLAACVALKPKA